jgi:hypothetical protein
MNWFFCCYQTKWNGVFRRFDECLRVWMRRRGRGDALQTLMWSLSLETCAKFLREHHGQESVSISTIH